jgi:glutaredoxin-related protein
MSFILYYSEYCNHSKIIVQELSKSQITKDIHFIKIDKRVQENGKTYIVLENNQKIILPDLINRVPALLKLADYSVVFGDDIKQTLKQTQSTITKVATQNNNEPLSFSFGGGGSGGGGIVSDNFCFLDIDAKDLSAEGQGGMRQLHSYMGFNQNDSISTPEDSNSNQPKNEKLPQGLTIEQLQKQRADDLDYR